MELEGRIKEIYDVFCDYYGEARVDVGKIDSSVNLIVDNLSSSFIGYYIMVYWNSVDVKNEQDESITIWGLYGIIPITREGLLRTSPSFTRSTYNNEQYFAGYLHSHLYTRDLSTIDSCKRFTDPCFGNGPIISTMDKIKHGFDIDIWRLFVWELDKMLHVESLMGGPYIRMSSIGMKLRSNELSMDSTYAPFNGNKRDFSKLLCKMTIDNGIFSYSYVNGQYCISNDKTKALLAMSDMFIERYNKDRNIRMAHPISNLVSTGLLLKAILYNGKLYTNLGRLQNNSISLQDSTLFQFKGNDVKLQIIDCENERNEVTIIEPNIFIHIFYTIQKFININYGREKTVFEENAKII